MEFIEAAYEKTAQRIAVWQIPEETAAGTDSSDPPPQTRVWGEN